MNVPPGSLFYSKNSSDLFGRISAKENANSAEFLIYKNGKNPLKKPNNAFYYLVFNSHYFYYQ